MDEMQDLLPPQEEESPRRRKGSDLFEWLQLLMGCVLAAVILFNCFARLTRVDGNSMDNTLRDGEMMLIWSLGYTPEQGDIVVLNKTDEVTRQLLGGKAIVKRVIATGGQTVDIDFDLGIVYVDGEALDESYTFEPTYRSYLEIGEGLDYPVTVPEGSVFVLGDNRNHSADSRYAPLGCVDESRILGRVLLRILPGRQTNEEGDVVGGRDFRRIGAVS